MVKTLPPSFLLSADVSLQLAARARGRRWGDGWRGGRPSARRATAKSSLTGNLITGNILIASTLTLHTMYDTLLILDDFPCFSSREGETNTWAASIDPRVRLVSQNLRRVSACALTTRCDRSHDLSFSQHDCSGLYSLGTLSSPMVQVHATTQLSSSVTAVARTCTCPCRSACAYSSKTASNTHSTPHPPCALAPSSSSLVPHSPSPPPSPSCFPPSPTSCERVCLCDHQLTISSAIDKTRTPSELCVLAHLVRQLFPPPGLSLPPRLPRPKRSAEAAISNGREEVVRLDRRRREIRGGELSQRPHR
jgi:hypothetical protein